MQKIIKTVIFIFALFVLFGGNLYANANATVEISGQIKDKKTKASLEFCSVRAFSTNDSLIVGGITDSKGFFKFPLEKGIYNLVFNYIGYNTDTVKITVGRKDKFLGVFKLEPDARSLAEVTVSGKTRENKLDKEVQLVTAKLRTGAAKTSDVLDKVTGLSYDRYNNSIKVDGDANIIILVNGLEKDQDYIKNLAPERLKEIEIIRDPSGRYAIEGYSAVINIILKSDYKGTEIYVENQVLLDADAADIALVIVNEFSATYNYTYNKVNFYAKFRNIYNDINIFNTTKKEYKDGLVIENNPFNNDVNLVAESLSNNYTVGLDYYLNPKHTISFESNLRALPLAKDLTKQKYDITHSENGIVTEQFTGETETLSRIRNSVNSLFYIGKLNNNNTINADFTYLEYADDYTNDYSESTGYNRNETGANNKSLTKLYVELEHNFSNNSSLTAGYGNTWKKLDNSFTFGNEIIAENDTNKFVLTDMRHKFYAYYSGKITPKISFKIGSAAEISKPDIDGASRSYQIFQPHADIKYSPIQMLNFKLKYRSRGNYPNISQANPFTRIIDSQTTETGNPYLEPEVTHKLSMRITAMQGLFSVEPYYHFSENYITRTISESNDEKIEYSYDNVGEYKHKGIKGNLTIPLFGQSLILQSNVNLYNSSISYDENNYDLNDWSMKQQIIYINKKYKTVSGLIYQKELIRRINAQGYNNENNDYWLLFVQQPFLKEKLNIMLAYMLPTDFGMNYNQGSYTETDTYTETNIADISIIKNIFIFRISYRFNKGKSIRKTDKDIQQETEKKASKIF